MRATEFISEKWSTKYKRSINCAHPKGFSQRAHCQGRKKNEDLNEFAPGGDDNRENNPEDVLFRFAKMWYAAPDMATQQRVEQALAKIGWEIGELESEEGGAFVMEIGDDAGDSYIAWSRDDLAQLNELTFKGSPCTKDCSGHRAGYEWSQRKGGVDAASWSPSFNTGASLFKNGY
jgi:hypothetical protein